MWYIIRRRAFSGSRAATALGAAPLRRPNTTTTTATAATTTTTNDNNGSNDNHQQNNHDDNHSNHTTPNITIHTTHIYTYNYTPEYNTEPPELLSIATTLGPTLASEGRGREGEREGGSIRPSAPRRRSSAPSRPDRAARPPGRIRAAIFLVKADIIITIIIIIISISSSISSSTIIIIIIIIVIMIMGVVCGPQQDFRS